MIEYVSSAITPLPSIAIKHIHPFRIVGYVVGQCNRVMFVRVLARDARGKLLRCCVCTREYPIVAAALSVRERPWATCTLFASTNCTIEYALRGHRTFPLHVISRHFPDGSERPVIETKVKFRGKLLSCVCLHIILVKDRFEEPLVPFSKSRIILLKSSLFLSYTHEICNSASKFEVIDPEKDLVG